MITEGKTEGSATERQDGFHRPRRPLLLISAAVLAVLAADLLMALVLWTQRQPRDLSITEPQDVKRQLAIPLKEEGPSWLLLGDSVLAGDVLAGQVDHDSEHRVIDYLRREKNNAFPDRFFQIALNGMLPVDMVRILTQLDRMDPEGRVGVVIEVNPRYFSRKYEHQFLCTRSWLNDLAPVVKEDGRVLWPAYWKATARAGVEWIRERVPVYRHRKRMPFQWSLLEDTRLVIANDESAGRSGGLLEGRARILEHYRNTVLGPDSAQMLALQEIVRRLGERGRTGVFFSTPLNDDFLGSALSEEAYGEYIATLARTIQWERFPRVSWVNLDHPLFVPSLFIDHCHLWPQGNRLLAVNLLNEMNVGLNAVPHSTEMVHPEGPGASFVYRADSGYRDGAAWQALFKEPKGIALSPSGWSLVIADSGNHCLRESNGNFQTVARLAGIPGKAGYLDGPALEAQLDSPSSPCFLNEQLFFADRNGRFLRSLEKGAVRTHRSGIGPGWREISQIRSSQNRLYLLESGRRILEYDPAGPSARVVARAPAGDRIRAFDVTPDSQLFLVNAKNQIWTRKMGDVQGSGAQGTSLELFFPNTGKSLLPLSKNLDTFPMRFDEVRFGNIVDVRYVNRYGGLLVFEDVRAAKKTKYQLTERIHIRFLRAADRQVYPWVKTNVYGTYFMRNVSTGSPVTRFHLGCSTLDPESGTLFYLEDKRSRLFSIEDGLWAVAKVGNINSPSAPDPFGDSCGPYVLENLRPDQYLPLRRERFPRKGPYVGMVIGSSMMAMSDIAKDVRQYSLARVLELRLREMLGYRDNIRLDLICRALPAGLLSRDVEAFETAVESGVGVDVLLIEIGGNRRFLERVRPADVPQYLDRLDEAASVNDTLVLFFNNAGMFAHEVDALRPNPPDVVRFIQIAREAGYEVLEPTDLLLREYLELIPWNSPPFVSHHASPWAVEATGKVLASLLYPPIQEHLRGRLPAAARSREPGPDSESGAQQLFPVFAELNVVPEELGFVVVEREAVQRAYRKRHLSIFVDLNKVSAFKEEGDANLLDRLAFSVLHQVLTQELLGRRASEATLTLATFSNYDEYGRGVQDSASVLYEKTFDQDRLKEYIQHLQTTFGG